jgi:hypothetical protein
MLSAGMSEPQPMESKPLAPPRSSGGGRRRGRRGGRGRGRSSRPTAPGASVEAIAADAPVSGQTTHAESSAQPIEPPIRVHEMPVRPAPSKPHPHKSPPPAPVEAPAEAPAVHAARPHGSAIGQAVQEVRGIVESLEQALEEMEEVLRLVESAEHQKFADEREIESLRRALHKLQPPHRERREPGG